MPIYILCTQNATHTNVTKVSNYTQTRQSRKDASILIVSQKTGSQTSTIALIALNSQFRFRQIETDSHKCARAANQNFQYRRIAMEPSSSTLISRATDAITSVSAKKFIFRSKKRRDADTSRSLWTRQYQDDEECLSPGSSYRRCFILKNSQSKSTNAEQLLQGLDVEEDEDFDTIVVVIPERMQASYGLYVWPCAPVLAWYLYEHRQFIQGKRVLELGTGTALPGIVAAACGASQVTLTDSAKLPHCLEQCQKAIEANQHLFKNSIPSNIKVVGLTWGSFLYDLLDFKGKVDLFIGSDCFYDPSVFEDLLSTVAYLLESNPGSKFLTTYQERSSDWSITTLLKKWDLECKHIPLSALASASEVDLFQLIQDHTIHLLEIQPKSPAPPAN